ncbi:MAG: hypothetical protein LC745_10800, partial [Planctomycetia bacterium]|nr:hypothetical protein [Planctomycetia bacterium]
FNLINPGADGKFGTRDDVRLRVGLVQYNSRAHTITLAIGPRALIHGTTALVVQPWGVTNMLGQSLDGELTGHPGSRFLVLIGL